MIIWITETQTPVEERSLPETPCPNCGHKGHLRMEACRVRSSSALWTTHSGRPAIHLHCALCRTEIAAKKMTPELKSVADEMTARNRTRFRLRPGWLLIGVFLLIVGGVTVERLRGYNAADTPAIRARNELDSALHYPGARTVLAVRESEGAKRGLYALIEKAESPVVKDGFSETRVTIRLSLEEYENPDARADQEKFHLEDFGEPIEAEIKTSLVSAPLTFRDPVTGKTAYFKVLNARPEALAR